MSSKKKLIISLSTLGLVLIAALIAVIVVLAAGATTVNTNITVTYTASDVAATLSANYSVAGANATNMTTDGKAESATTIEFLGSEEENASKTLTPQGSITLDKTNNYVVFEYVLTNTSTTKDFYATLSYTDSNADDTNMAVSYLVSSTAVAEGSYASASFTDASSTTYVSGQKVEANTTTYVYVKVAINKVASDAAFSGVFNWALTVTAPQA